jgi:multiple sugar transport system ATP-binding protein
VGECPNCGFTLKIARTLSEAAPGSQCRATAQRSVRTTEIALDFIKPLATCFAPAISGRRAAGDTMASVAVQKVRKAFGSSEVIHGVDIAIDDGEFVVLVGPSGCGKSTLLRMVAGLENVTAGEIRIGDVVVNDLPPKQRDVAMVFQNYALYPHMTVAANMGFSLRLRGAPKAEIDARVQRAAEILGLGAYLDRFPRQLSGGQRQRVAMGRAIVRDPQVFLFDEPLSNLDAKLRVQMRTEIKELHQKLATTTIYVTHDQIEAMTMADKIVVMHDGLVEQIGAPLDLYDRPGNLFVAGFIGSPAMNFLRGTIGAKGALVFRGPDGIRLPLASAPANAAGRPVVYGVRPEHFAIVDDGAEAEIQVIEPTGSETQVVARLGGQDVTAVFRERHPFKPGDKIRLKPDPRLVHLFDETTGQRLVC